MRGNQSTNLTTVFQDCCLVHPTEERRDDSAGVEDDIKDDSNVPKGIGIVEIALGLCARGVRPSDDPKDDTDDAYETEESHPAYYARIVIERVLASGLHHVNDESVDHRAKMCQA